MRERKVWSVEVQRIFREQKLTANAILTEEGIQVLICGGDRTHIGAVTVVGSDRGRMTLQFPGHRDAYVGEKWAEELSLLGLSPVVVSAGIHYDNLSKEEIAEILLRTDDMLQELKVLIADAVK